MPLGFRFNANADLLDELTAARLNALCDACDAAEIRSGVGYLARRGPGGTVLQVRTRGGSAGGSEAWPFQGYASAYTGGGSPPSDQARRVRVKPGVVNGLPPSNLSAEHTCSASSTTFFWVETSHAASGALTAVEVKKGSVIPTESAGSPGVAPTKSYCGIFQVVTSDDGITSIDPLRQASLQVLAVVVAVGCEENTLAYQWT